MHRKLNLHIVHDMRSNLVARTRSRLPTLPSSARFSYSMLDLLKLTAIRCKSDQMTPSPPRMHSACPPFLHQKRLDETLQSFDEEATAA
jgi:hypothetical protein